MAERKLRPYLTNIADTIRSKMYNPNLYDAERYPLEIGHYIDYATGYYNDNPANINCATESYIPCNEMRGKTYTINYVEGRNTSISFYDADKKLISSVKYGLGSGVVSSITFIVPNDASFYRFTASAKHKDEIKIEEGERVTEYTPFGYRPPINAQDFPEKVNEVYDKGRTDEWSDFWDVFQRNGSRTNYDYAFYGDSTSVTGWNDTTFKPKYSMFPTTLASCFRAAQFTDFKGIFEKQGIVFDTSNCTGFVLTWQNCSKLTRLPEINTKSCSALNTTFAYATNMKSIDKLILKDDGTQTFSATFTYANSLQDIVIEGVIGTNISFQHSPLSVESMKSIITALKDYSGTDKEFTYTLTLSSDCWTALEAEGATAPNGMTWMQYIESKCWETA